MRRKEALGRGLVLCGSPHTAYSGLSFQYRCSGVTPLASKIPSSVFCCTQTFASPNPAELQVTNPSPWVTVCAAAGWQAGAHWHQGVSCAAGAAAARCSEALHLLQQLQASSGTQGLSGHGHRVSLWADSFPCLGGEACFGVSLFWFDLSLLWRWAWLCWSSTLLCKSSPNLLWVGGLPCSGRWQTPACVVFCHSERVP